MNCIDQFFLILNLLSFLILWNVLNNWICFSFVNLTIILNFSIICNCIEQSYIIVSKNLNVNPSIWRNQLFNIMSAILCSINSEFIIWQSACTAFASVARLGIVFQEAVHNPVSLEYRLLRINIFSITCNCSVFNYKRVETFKSRK